MVIGLVTASISIPEAHSLKDKRSVLRSLRDRVLNTMNVSVAEVGRQDAWQYSEMAFVTVAAETEVVQQRMSAISDFLRASPRHVLLNLHTELL
jgi:uncharacterized protein YlxP (DUF503 family)